MSGVRVQSLVQRRNTCLWSADTPFVRDALRENLVSTVTAVTGGVVDNPVKEILAPWVLYTLLYFSLPLRCEGWLYPDWTYS